MMGGRGALRLEGGAQEGWDRDALRKKLKEAWEDWYYTWPERGISYCSKREDRVTEVQVGKDVGREMEGDKG